MGEAKRRKGEIGTLKADRPWAKGSMRIEANGELCFEWSGTKDEAADLRQRYLDAVKFSGHSAESYAKRAASYMMAFGMPQVGEPDRRPSFLGENWKANDVDLYRAAVVWLVLREFVPQLRRKLEDVFVGKQLLVMFEGDKEQIIDETVRELKGQSFSGNEFKMTATVIGDYMLDPDDAIAIPLRDLCTIRGREATPEDLPDELVYVPRIPRDAAEADAMLQRLIIFSDITRPEQGIRDFAGYTEDELRRGKPAVAFK